MVNKEIEIVCIGETRVIWNTRTRQMREVEHKIYAARALDQQV